jgi:ELWxxDGT repeat protein
MDWLDSLRSRLNIDSRNTRRSAKRAGRRHGDAKRARLERLEDRLALSVSMVSDINSYTNPSNPGNITDVGGTAFFTATDNTNNVELFKTDGSAAGTTQFTFGNRFSNFQDLESLGGKLYFVANDSTLGYRPLCVSDGTVAGTVPFTPAGDGIYTGLTDTTSMAVSGGKLYFQAYDGSNAKYDLWETNGTNSGTHPVDPGDANAPQQYLVDFTNVSNKLYFESYNYTSGHYTLWKSDGTAAGTSLVKEFSTSAPTNFTAVGSKLYFEMYDSTTSLYALWKSDGTSAGTTMVADIGTVGTPFYDPTAFGSSKLFFQVYDFTDSLNTGYALWSSDGTAANTGAFKFSGGTTPVQVAGNTPMAVIGSTLYFNGYDTTNGYSLWKTDGSTSGSGTAIVQTSGSLNYYPTQLTVNGSELYFTAQNPSDSNNTDLWKSNGTSAGTVPVQTSGFPRGISDIAVSNGKLLFDAYDVDAQGYSPHNYELWTSDGTNGGTAMVTDINTTTPASSPTGLIAVGSEIFFSTYTYAPPSGYNLWQSDGTVANTLPVQTSMGSVPTNEGNAIAVGSSLFFTAYSANGYDLWTSGAATKSAVELFPTGTNPFSGTFDSYNADAFANVGGTLYFGAYDAANAKYALWKSDGTAAGTTVVADLDPSYQLSHLTAVGSNLFWQQYDSITGQYALWQYNGTSASLVSDITNYGISNLTAVGGKVFFQGYDPGTNQYALWTSNGTTTTNLAEVGTGQSFVGLTAFNGKLYFGAYEPSVGEYTLWTSDGTVAGTTQFVSATSQPVYVSSVPDFTAVGGELFGDFIGVGGQQGLGKTDGTQAGTGLVQLGGSSTFAVNPSNLANDNGTLVFNAYDSAHGYELWQSDGTANGTTLTADIVPGTNYSYPQYMTMAGSQVFFSADDGRHGAELWSATLGAAGSGAVTAGLSGPTDGVTEQHRAFVLTANDSFPGNNAAGFAFNIQWGDGTSQTVSGLSGITTDHQYATTGNHTISVTATNLADSVTSAAVTQVENITNTEVQGGNLALGGQAGNNAFVITKGTVASSYTIKDNTTTLVTNFKPATGEEILLYGGNGTNTYTINDTLATADTFTLGTGYVTFIKATFVPQAPGGWTINGNTGKDIFNLVGAANASIVGGSGINTYNVATGASLTGSINGGSGTQNLLSYAKYSSPSGVVADLLLGTATAISGGISHIENVTGSLLGGDILVGDASPNILIASKGHDIIIGGSGGGDTLTSLSPAISILIAGSTNYDSNIPALQTILTKWKTATTANSASVVAAIEDSGFADPLNSTTVPAEGSPDAPDTLTGSTAAAADWYFAHLSGTGPYDTITSNQTGDTETEI